MKHEATFEIELGDDLYGVVVTYFNRVEGDKGTWASDVDYYGYTESEWEVCDRRGRPAHWLARKLNSKECSRIESEIAEYMN